MEFYTSTEQAFLEELLSLKDTDTSLFTDQDFTSFINGGFVDDSFVPTNPNFYSPPLSDFYAPFVDHFSPPDFTVDSYTAIPDSQTRPYEDNPTHFGHTFADPGPPCKIEAPPEFNTGFCPPPVVVKNKAAKKLNGQPSKNLMAERRPRKRLNDRLSMLRSIVPKISKMDRTSILGDTIDYLKELLQRINCLHEEMGSNQLSIFHDIKPSELVVRNSAKFEVERKNGGGETRIEICCNGKPGLLLSTVTTLEALGLDIHQCVISCFNDFALHASCTEELKKRAMLDSEDIKQALVRNAGYGGAKLG